MLLSQLSRQKVLLSLTIQNALVPLAIATQCYFTDGSATLAEQQPCFPDKINGPCCGINKSNGDPNDICLTNGLCLAQVSPYTGLILLNACTDPTWESNDCPSICPKCARFKVLDLLSGDGVLIQCSTDSNPRKLRDSCPAVS